MLPVLLSTTCLNRAQQLPASVWKSCLESEDSKAPAAPPQCCALNGEGSLAPPPAGRLHGDGVLS